MDRLGPLRIVFILAAALVTTGCELVGDIFQAGMWVGVIMVVAIIGVVLFAVAKLKS